MQIDWMKYYYILNTFWVNFNPVGIIPLIIACINRYRNPSIDKKLLSDYIPRFFYLVTCIFYVFDTIVKYVVDGGETLCQKALFIHHTASQFIILPLVFNNYMPWWANPVGFLHGFLVYFPEMQAVNYIYAVALSYFQYNLYQEPFTKLPFYRSTRYAINGIWVFAIFLMIGDCSNYLPTSPD